MSKEEVREWPAASHGSNISNSSGRSREEFDGGRARVREETSARRQRIVNGNRRVAMADDY